MCTCIWKLIDCWFLDWSPDGWDNAHCSCVYISACRVCSVGSPRPQKTTRAKTATLEHGAFYIMSEIERRRNNKQIYLETVTKNILQHWRSKVIHWRQRRLLRRQSCCCNYSLSGYFNLDVSSMKKLLSEVAERRREFTLGYIFVAVRIVKVYIFSIVQSAKRVD